MQIVKEARRNRVPLVKLCDPWAIKPRVDNMKITLDLVLF